MQANSEVIFIKCFSKFLFSSKIGQVIPKTDFINRVIMVRVRVIMPVPMLLGL